MSLTTLSLTLCYRFIHSSQLEFRTLDFFIPCRSLYRKLWFKLLKLENPISYGHAISFLMHVVAHLSHYVVFYTTLPYLFIHSSQLDFRNLDYFIPCRSFIVSFDSTFETRKSDIIRPRYELFNACGGSCPSLPCLWRYVTFSFTPLNSSVGI